MNHCDSSLAVKCMGPAKMHWFVWTLLIVFFAAETHGITYGFGPWYTPTAGEPWPKPQQRKTYDGFMVLRPSMFRFKVTGESCDILHEAIKRYYIIITESTSSISGNTTKNGHKHWRKHADFRGYLNTLQIKLLDECESMPSLDMDEQYILKINTPDMPKGGLLASESIWGILRGLETFTHLLFTSDDDLAGLHVLSTLIADFPAFPHRGVLLDTSRHFLPKFAILETLDLMAMNKFNVFHWHIVDDNSFPYQSKKFPDLSDKGAYQPYTHVYSQVDIQEIIEYARLRGIRVIPEFDTPGHTLSWGPGQPGFLTPCYSGGEPDGTYGPTDPTNSSNYVFLKKLFAEVSSVFPDSYVHLGGDEVDFTCWQSNPQIRQFMEAQNYTSYAQLESYYMQKLIGIVQKTNNYIIWQEVVDNGVVVNKETVVHVWKDGSSFAPEMEKVTALGHRSLLSSCWYLNEISYGIDWPKYYECDPLAFQGSDAQKNLVMGGEACMWGEYVDATNLTPRLWPRASAVAERLWTYVNISKTTDETHSRLEEHRCRLLRRGYRVEPGSGSSFCLAEWTDGKQDV